VAETAVRLTHLCDVKRSADVVVVLARREGQALVQRVARATRRRVARQLLRGLLKDQQQGEMQYIVRQGGNKGSSNSTVQQHSSVLTWASASKLSARAMRPLRHSFSSPSPDTVTSA